MSNVQTLYFIHHSHTDIGYTHDQPIVWDLHERFIDEALDLADKYAAHDSDGAFRWTVETTGVLSRWLQHAPRQRVERFAALEKAGRIEVTGMFTNLTPLYDTDELIESFQLLRSLREEFGFTIRSAMNCDVNGENWPLVDVLLDLGIDGFSMAINTHFGGAPFERPNAFWWQGPSGREILAWNGWPYDQGWRLGLGRDAADFEQTWWPRVERRLAEIDYPLPVLMVQSYHPFGDNGSAFEGFVQFIDTWNEQGKVPRLRQATPQMWWAAVREYGHLLPTYRGDWTDYWNFGCISSAREQAINRASRVRLRSADAIAAAVLGGADRKESLTARSFQRHRALAGHAMHLWDEHTWGADVSLYLPDSIDVASQWNHKANYAYTARSLSLLLQRDALAGLARQVERTAPTDILVFNPLPWPRLITGQVYNGVLVSRGVPEDVTAVRHFQDRLADEDRFGIAVEPAETAAAGRLRFALKPVEVPGFGYAVVSRADLIELRPATTLSDDAIVENERYRLTFDRQRGGILSWYDKVLNREWVDQSAGYPFNGFVHETLADRSEPWPRKLMFEMLWFSDEVERPRGWKPAWPVERSQPTEVLAHQVYHTPLGDRVVQLLKAPGCVGPLKQSVFIPNFANYIECESRWQMGLETHPEATYLAYPLNVPGATARLDLGGQAIVAGVDQLPGVCRDYFTVQQWVDFSNETFGVTIALPENPMIQLGDFHFGHNQAECRLERAMLLGWITNNYWETNFRANQPGVVHARYRLAPHRGGFNEAQAHRFGLEAAHAQPLLQHMGEPVADPPVWPASGSLLRLPETAAPDSPILTLHVKPAEHPPGVIVRLLNASDTEQQARLGSGLVRILTAEVCDLVEQPLHEIEVRDGVVSLNIPPRRVVTVHLWV
jgi:hypothetical protein